MSLDLEGKTCPACKSYLFDEDDVVYCPVCGAPHHRDCYETLGHCALEAYHGTDKQYDKLEQNRVKSSAEHHRQSRKDGTENICAACGNAYDANLSSCPNCGAPNFSRLGGRFVTVNFDPLGGVNSDIDIGEGVTAGEAGRFVAVNTGRYISKFAAMAAGFKNSWNWMAFLFPATWLMARKVYKQGIIAMLLSVVISLFQMPFLAVLSSVDISPDVNYQQAFMMIRETFAEQSIWVTLSFFLSCAAYLALRILLGVFGDRIYYKHTVSNVKRIKSGDDDADTAYGRRGGVSFGLMLLSYVVIRFVPNIIASFIM